jgi:MFS family permease
MLSLNTGDDEQGEVLGVGQSLSSLARIIGPVVGLSLQDRDLALPYWFAGALMAVGIVLIARLKSIPKSDSNNQPAAASSH